MTRNLFVAPEDHKYFKHLSKATGVKMVAIVSRARKALELILKDDPGFLTRIESDEIEELETR